MKSFRALGSFFRTTSPLMNCSYCMKIMPVTREKSPMSYVRDSTGIISSSSFPVGLYCVTYFSIINIIFFLWLASLKHSS